MSRWATSLRIKERLVSFYAKQRWIGRNALCLECPRSRFLDQGRKILAGRFIADLAVRLARNEAQIGNIVRLATCVAGLEHSLGEDVMELEPVLRA